MRLTKKLLSFLNRVFDKDPESFLALRLRYNGGMAWRVADGVLTTTVDGGTGMNLRIPLASYTLNQLVILLAAQPGYSVDYADTSEYRALSALVLVDGSNDIDLSNGDHLRGYTSALWSYAESAASELAAAETQIGQMLQQMSTKTAAGEWLDELGSYYGVPRLVGEVDAQYGPRIIVEVIRPRANNVAMEIAISTFTGQETKVTNVVTYGGATPAYNGVPTHNAVQTHNASASVRYGLFDVEYAYDLQLGGSLEEFQTKLAGVIDRLRDAGTHLRSLSLTSSSVVDALETQPTDEGNRQALRVNAPLTDSVSAASDSALAVRGEARLGTDLVEPPLDDNGLFLIIAAGYVHSGARRHNGAFTYANAANPAERF